MRKISFALAALLFVFPAFATADKPHCLDKVIEAQAPYGEGKLSRLFLSVYEASLWTDAKDWSMDSVFALSIHYDLDLDNDDLVDRSMEEMQHVKPIPADKVAFYKAELTRIFPDVKKGEIITALYDPEKGLTFFHNDKLRGQIKDADLSKRFMSIWFAPNTSEPGLRASLLGSHSG